ncbi:MAG: cytochrome c biogenesis protein ResB [Thermomicrobiales bacterium]
MTDISLPTQPSRPVIDMVIDRIWRFFCSVRAAVAEISLLALLVLIGTLRGSNAPQWFANGLPFLQPIVDRWYAWNVYGSALFAALLVVISIAVAVCTVNRVPGIWQVISHPRVTTSNSWLRSADISATFSSEGNVEALADDIRSMLRRQRYRVLTEKVGPDIHVYADKNRYAKLGTFPFHLALILMLVGGVVASQFGFRDQQFIVTEGETRSVGHNTGLSVRLDRFSDTYVPMGVARDYQSDLTIFDGTREAKVGSITVNHPISYRNATFYQSSFGNSVVLKVTDSSGSVVFSNGLPMATFNLKGNPDAPAGLIELPASGSQLVVVGPDIAPFKQPELDKLQLQSGQLWIQINDRGRSANGALAAGADKVITLGQPAQIGGYTVLFEREKRNTVLQVAYNPGVPIFIIASVLLVGGLAAVFFFPLRRLRAIVSATPQGSAILIAPLAKRDWSGKQDFMRMVGKAAEMLGAPQHVKVPDKGSEWERFGKSPTSPP